RQIRLTLIPYTTLFRSRDEWQVTCVLFAPNAPDQNPIEDVWLKAKQYVRKHWRECPTFELVMHMFEEALNTLSFRFEKLRMYLRSEEHTSELQSRVDIV